ncbi:MAG: DnaJ C-terminal domain-containing protein [Thermomicrobiales bacterium]
MATVQFRDYYKTLGVESSADEKAIRAAYRKLARKHHPDVNRGEKASEEKFREVNEAYEVLSDPEKRKMYDRYGADWQRYREAGFTGNESYPSSGGARPADFGQWFTGQSDGGFRVEFDQGEPGGFSDFFQTLFGSGRRAAGGFTSRRQRRRGEDVELKVDVTFEEALRGTARRFEVKTPEVCGTCGGTGLARGTTCPTCDGTGMVERSKSIEVKIPAGVQTGSKIRVAGQGGSGQDGGPAGDAYLIVNVKPSARFERLGDDLKTNVDVPLYTALLGGEAVVRTPTGQVALTIPPETQAGKIFRLRGQGMPKLRSTKNERGDLLAQIRLKLPEKLSAKEKSLIKELRDIREGAE